MTSAAGVVTSIRVTHDEASLDAIEAAALPDREAGLDALLAQPAVRGAFVLQTCHRVEAYAVTPHRAAAEQAFRTVLEAGDEARIEGHEASLRHLLRVAAGLESVVIGEDQILGQMRDAAETARQADALCPLLEAVVEKAIHVGERARTETEINEGAVSMGSAAVRAAAREEDIAGAHAAVVGAGEMGRLAASALAERVDELTVLNRTPERAASITNRLPSTVDTEAGGLEVLQETLTAVDLAVTATASTEPILTAETLRTAGPIRIMDLGQPRDVEPVPELSGVTVHDLEDVEAVTDRTAERRKAAAEGVAEMVEAELEALLEQLKRRRADDVIAAMYESAERVKRREVRTALDQMTAQGELNEAQREAVRDMADALVNQLLAAPTRSLRDAAAADDWETIDTALTLFDPNFEADDSPFPTQSEGGADIPDGILSEGEE
ncbi:MAG: glutamyl-tRNA reductase [Halobacteriaceae archaeon]